MPSDNDGVSHTKHASVETQSFNRVRVGIPVHERMNSVAENKGKLPAGCQGKMTNFA